MTCHLGTVVLCAFFSLIRITEREGREQYTSNLAVFPFAQLIHHPRIRHKNNAVEVYIQQTTAPITPPFRFFFVWY